MKKDVLERANELSKTIDTYNHLIRIPDEETPILSSIYDDEYHYIKLSKELWSKILPFIEEERDKMQEELDYL